MPTAGGPPHQCQLKNLQNNESPDKNLQVSLGYGTFNSTLGFDGDTDVKADMTTVSFSASRLIRRNLTLRGGLGLILDGELKPERAVKQSVEPGGSAALGLEYHAFAGKGMQPFVDLSMMVSASRTRISNPHTDQQTTYFATDLRLGILTSWNIKNRFYPFAAARVFGGPVQWELEGESVMGTDIYHYQVSLGSAIRMAKSSIYFEWAGIGEKTVSFGFSINI